MAARQQSVDAIDTGALASAQMRLLEICRVVTTERDGCWQEPAGRFRIAAGAFGATEETDGIALSSGDFRPLYPSGLFVAQGGANGRSAQNSKLVPWHQIEEALKEWEPPVR